MRCREPMSVEPLAGRRARALPVKGRQPLGRAKTALACWMNPACQLGVDQSDELARRGGRGPSGRMASRGILRATNVLAVVAHAIACVNWRPEAGKRQHSDGAKPSCHRSIHLGLRERAWRLYLCQPFTSRMK